MLRGNMLRVVMMNAIMLSVIMLSDYAEGHYAERYYAEGGYDECHHAECHCTGCHYTECHYFEFHIPECRYAECCAARLWVPNHERYFNMLGNLIVVKDHLPMYDPDLTEGKGVVQLTSPLGWLVWKIMCAMLEPADPNILVQGRQLY
jgi:hypothetical protein